MERKLDSDRSNKQEEIKKSYHKPEVLIYGNIREITKNIGPMGNTDGGGGPGGGIKTGA
jgi:hypothetical protein